VVTSFVADAGWHVTIPTARLSSSIDAQGIAVAGQRLYR
jgi:hypothetical protein